ncbi:MAG: hypothetical protein C0425_01395 [Chlorobiaceae bacterium]|nr:hypothetical protein [Chlorobiaceae bacterium]MBA4308974.1 hypothetical protein [Chlorobiaceae bacterium]
MFRFITRILSSLLAITPLLIAQSDYKVLSSDRTSVTISFRPDYTDSSFKLLDGNNFRNVSFKNEIHEDRYQFGKKINPLRKFLVGVPSEFGNTIQVISSSFKEIEGDLNIYPTPIKVSGRTEFKFVDESRNQDEIQFDEIVRFGKFGITRGLQIQDIDVFPIKYFRGGKNIRLLTEVVFKINFANGFETNSIIVPDELTKNLVVNYDVAKNWKQISDSRFRKVANNSLLSTGRWYRFEAPDEGIYRITRAMLSSYGINPATVDPRTIKIYNNGGMVLPEANSSAVPLDLVEIAISVVGESDGVFNENDYILFYGRGVNFWNPDTVINRVTRVKHPYSKENYFWITVGTTPGKRIANKVSLNVVNPIVKNTSQAFVFFEEDIINIGNTGRMFLGDEFNPNSRSRTYMNKLESYKPASEIIYRYQVVNASSNDFLMTIEESGRTILSRNLWGFGTYQYSHGLSDSMTFRNNVTIAGDRSTLRFTFNASASNDRAFLDFFEIFYQRMLSYDNAPYTFYSDRTAGVVEYQLNNFPSSNVRVFDLTDYANVKLISNPTMQSGGEFRFQVVESANKISKYFAIEGENFLTPKNPVEIKNQNLKGNITGARYIIITSKEFLTQANRLKNYRQNDSPRKLSSLVFDVEEIFNEFNAGIRDVSAIRNFLRFAYSNWTIKPDYVLLFGDGNYDYRNIEGQGKNFVIPYQTQESLDQISSYVTDDFFVAVHGDDIKVDLISGRINVQTNTDAVSVVDKIIKYENSTDRGTWRNLITLVADDGKTSYGDDGAVHTNQSEDISALIPQSFDRNKIYLAAYPTVITSLGRRKPAVNNALVDAINEGTVIVNYFGHGSPELWAHEQVFVQSVSIPQLVNDRYTFISAATCDFAYYDRTSTQSSTEELINKPNSGAIGVITASRAVYSFQNYELASSFFRNLFFSPRDSLNFPISVGKAIFETKQDLMTENDQKFHLFGDPAIRLAIPEYNANIDTINGVVPTSAVQVKALGQLRINGTVRKADGTHWNNFNGEGILTVFDSRRRIPLPELSFNAKMELQGGILFRGRVSITNGSFSNSFFVPKDISYENENGKIVLYFYNDQVDGIAFSDKIIVGGTDTTTVNDNKGPMIDITFDNADYDNVFLVNSNSTLIVKLNDETGINTTGLGIGHKLEGYLNDDEINPIDFTNYFTGDLDAGGRSGKINYRFNNLKSGEQKISVRAWDVFNNPTNSFAYFKVVDQNRLSVEYVMNYPNPFSENTTFTFQHNLSDAINVRVKIYTVAGRLIQDLERRNITTERFVKINWDGRDRDANKIANGTYLYKLIVESTDGTFKESVLGKLTVVK